MGEVKRIPLDKITEVRLALENSLEAVFGPERSLAYTANIVGFLQGQSPLCDIEVTDKRVSIQVPLNRELVPDVAILTIHPNKRVTLLAEHHYGFAGSVVNCRREEEYPGEKRLGLDTLVFNTAKGGEVSFVKEKDTGRVTIYTEV